jgi:hypothetical protein
MLHAMIKHAAKLWTRYIGVSPLFAFDAVIAQYIALKEMHAS